MVRFWLIAVGAALLATGAQAQDSTTRCRMAYGEMVCDTQTNQRNTYQQASDAAAQRQAASANAYAAIGARFAAEERAKEARHQARIEEILLKRLGGYISEGRCDHAYNVALKEGRFDLAKEVRALCPTPAQ